MARWWIDLPEYRETPPELRRDFLFWMTLKEEEAERMARIERKRQEAKDKKEDSL